MKKFYMHFLFIFVIIMFLFSTCSSNFAEAQPLPIKHVVIIIMENHTFDNYFGTYPGANGLKMNEGVTSNNVTIIKPYHLEAIPQFEFCNDSMCAHKAYDYGKMDGFVSVENSTYTMGYYDFNDIPYYWNYASQFVLLDNYYSSVMSQSIPNHLYLLAAQSGTLYNNPATVDKNIQNIVTITDRLDGKNIPWKFYYNFTRATDYIEEFKSNEKSDKVVPAEQFLYDVRNDALPNVAWITPEPSEHPPENIKNGEHLVVRLVNAIMQSNYWNSTAIFITWDDWGGWYDHVSPPQVDKFGYGFRVPLLIISPYAKQNFIDHTQSEHASILKFIETVFSLYPLTERDASSNDLTESFDFSQSPRSPLILPGQYIPEHYPLSLLTETVPSAPARLIATAESTSQINLRWTAPVNNGGLSITGYKIERSSDGGTTWSTLVSNTDSAVTTFSDTGLASSTTYTYRVSAIDSVGTSFQSNTAFVTTDAEATAPGLPDSLTATAESTSQINLRWTAPVNNGGLSITGYKIERSSDGGTTWYTLSSNISATTYSDTGLAAGTQYVYRISAINSAGIGFPLSIASATASALATVPEFNQFASFILFISFVSVTVIALKKIHCLSILFAK